MGTDWNNMMQNEMNDTRWQAKPDRDGESMGHALRTERERRGLTLEEIARVTRVPLVSLVALEEDRYEALPSDVFVRGFLRSYAQVLGVDPAEWVQRYEQVRHPAPVELASLLTPHHLADPRRRWGMGVALVLLLVLFTLVVSIALRPRQRGGPVELSRVDSSRLRAPQPRDVSTMRDVVDPTSGFRGRIDQLS
jgi:cytoskeletal protein RodZ